MPHRQTRPSSTGNLAVRPTASSGAAQAGLGDQNRGDQAHFAVQARLWGALHERLGQAQVAELLAEGPRDATELQILHVAGFVESTGLDAQAYLPWNAPLSWQARTAPFYRILWQSLREEQAAEVAAPEPSTQESSGISFSESEGFDAWVGVGAEADAVQESGDSSGEIDAIAPAADLGFADGGAVLSREALGAGLPSAGFESWFGGRLSAAGAGRALSGAEQDFLREVHGREFPDVRVHEGPTVRSLSQGIAARAFTMGSDIYLGESGDLLANADSAGLLAHEATHVVQAGRGGLPAPSSEGLEVSQPNQPHEREAEAIGHRAAAVFHTFVQADPNTLDGRVDDDGWSLDPGWDSDPVGRAVAAHLRAVLPAGAQADEAAVSSAIQQALRGRASASLAEQAVLTDVAESLGADGETIAAVRAALGHLESALDQSEGLPDLLDLTGAPTAGELLSIGDSAPLPGFAEVSASVLGSEGPSDGMLSGAGLGGMLFEGSADGGALSRRALPGSGDHDASDSVDAALQTRGSGQLLPDDLRVKLESKLGVNLAAVRLHTDARAAAAAEAVRAEAFTVGTDIYLNRGVPSLSSSEGQELLAHEATHAAQHLEGRAGQATGTEGGVGVTRPGDAVEREAEAMGEAFARESASGALDLAVANQAVADPALSEGGADTGATAEQGAATGAATEGALARDEKEDGNKKAATPEGQTGDQAGTKDVLDGSAVKGGDKGKPGSKTASNAPAKGDVFTDDEAKAISEKWKNQGAYQVSDTGDQKPNKAWIGYKANVQALLKRPGEDLAPADKTAIKDWLARYEAHQIWDLRKTGDAPPIPGDPPEALLSAPMGEGHLGPPPATTHEKVMKYEITMPDGTTQITYKDHPVKGDYKYLLDNTGVAKTGTKLKDRKDVDQQFTNAGIPDGSQKNVMKAVSELEGGFEAVNTYDTGYVSVGIIQFTTGKDGNGSLADVMRKTKDADPKQFATYFHDLGIDVDKNGLTVVDPETGKTLHGSDAVTAVMKDKRLTAVFQQAGQASGAFQTAQLQTSAEKYYAADFDIKPIKVQSMTVDGKTEYFYGDQAKQQAEAAAKKAGKGATVGEMPAISGKYGDAFQSEAGKAALMDRWVQTGSAKKQFNDAALDALRKNQVTSMEGLANHERDMIPKVQNRLKVLSRKDLTQPK